MNTETSHITVANIRVEILRKDIKNLHMGVYPPNGRVRVAAPLLVSDEAVRLAVIGKLAWIKRQREKFQTQPRQSERAMVRGESHYHLGQRYRLNVVEQPGKRSITLRGKSMVLTCPAGSTTEQRTALLLRWQRAELKSLLEPLLKQWQTVLGVTVATWGVKRMKTKWGSCNPQTASLWFNLELIKKAPACIEYIVLHELMHLVERHHNDRFTALLDQHLPNWRSLQQLLNQSVLGHERWG